MEKATNLGAVTYRNTAGEIVTGEIIGGTVRVKDESGNQEDHAVTDLDARDLVDCLVMIQRKNQQISLLLGALQQMGELALATTEASDHLVNAMLDGE